MTPPSIKPTPLQHPPATDYATLDTLHSYAHFIGQLTVKTWKNKNTTIAGAGGERTRRNKDHSNKPRKITNAFLKSFSSTKVPVAAANWLLPVTWLSLPFFKANIISIMMPPPLGNSSVTPPPYGGSYSYPVRLHAAPNLPHSWATDLQPPGCCHVSYAHLQPADISSHMYVYSTGKNWKKMGKMDLVPC